MSEFDSCQNGVDNYNYHLYFIPPLYHFCYTFNTAWVFLFIFMQKLGKEHKLEKRDKKQKIVVKEIIAAVYFKIQTSRDLIDLSKKSIKYG